MVTKRASSGSAVTSRCNRFICFFQDALLDISSGFGERCGQVSAWSKLTDRCEQDVSFDGCSVFQQNFGEDAAVEGVDEFEG
jgi:hypothetical protein